MTLQQLDRIGTCRLDVDSFDMQRYILTKRRLFDQDANVTRKNMFLCRIIHVHTVYIYIHRGFFCMFQS